MRWLGAGLLVVVAGVCSGACSGSDDSGDGTPTYTPNPALCKSACEAMANAGCSVGLPDDCQQDCEGTRERYAGCLPQVDALFSCGTSNGWDCSSGSLTAVGCDAQQHDLSMCGACTPGGSDSACDVCSKKACCAEYQAFGDAPGLDGFRACIENCFTPDCLTACEQQFPDAASAFHAVDTCRGTSCPSACNGEPSTADPVGRLCAAAANAGCGSDDCELGYDVDDPFGCGLEMYAAIECAASRPVSCVDGQPQFDEGCLTEWKACAGVE